MDGSAQNTVKAFSHINFFGAASFVCGEVDATPSHHGHINHVKSLGGRLYLNGSKTSEFKDLCCKSYVFNLVNVQGEGFFLSGFCSYRMLQTRWAHNTCIQNETQDLQECDPGIWWHLSGCSGMYWDLLGVNRTCGQRWEGSGTTLETTPKRPQKRPSKRPSNILN